MNRIVEDRNAGTSGDASARRSSRERDPSTRGWRGHLLFGWYALLLYLVLGAALETLHGFKVDFYLNVANETRRLLWTLAHAHGTLLALINIAFALTARAIPEFKPSTQKFASRCLIAATVLLPAGFFFGGVFIAGGDPGLPVVLVPIGALLLFAGVFIIARASAAARESESAPKPPHADERKKNRSNELTRA